MNGKWSGCVCMYGDICVRKAAERFGLVVMVFLVMGLSLLLLTTSTLPSWYPVILLGCWWQKCWVHGWTGNVDHSGNTTGTGDGLLWWKSVNPCGQLCCCWPKSVNPWGQLCCCWPNSVYPWGQLCCCWPNSVYPWGQLCCCWPKSVNPWGQLCCCWPKSVNPCGQLCCCWPKSVNPVCSRPQLSKQGPSELDTTPVAVQTASKLDLGKASVIYIHCCHCSHWKNLLHSFCPSV